MAGESVVQYVAGSSVRTDTLLAVAGDTLETADLLERVGASESAVYNALTALERRQLIVPTDDGWGPTGSGRLVATALSDQRALGDLLEAEYWQTHDVSPLPPRFRTSAGALAGCRVERASEADPYGLVRKIAEIVESTGDIDIVSPIYQPEYARSMPDSEDARLIIDHSVIDETIGDPDEGLIDDPGEEFEIRVFERTRVRLLDVDIALTVTSSDLVLSLPTLEGDYDPKSSIIADHDGAIEWGEALFEHYWHRATPVEEIIDLESLPADP